MIENMIKRYAGLVKPYVRKLTDNDYLKIKKLVLEKIEEEDRRRGLQ